MVVATNLGWAAEIYIHIEKHFFYFSSPSQLSGQLPAVGHHCWLGGGDPLPGHRHHGLLHLHASRLRQTNPPSSNTFLPGFAWLADQVDMTGFRNSVVFLGGNSGWLIFPPLAGIIIFSGPGGVGVYLLSLGEFFFV